MKYKLHEITDSYAREQAQISCALQNILKKNNIEIRSITPVSILFTPWPTGSLQIDQNMTGVLSWNPVSRTVTVTYHVALPTKTGSGEYSRVLRWYLLKRNEEHARFSRHLNAVFSYPGEDGSELVLKGSRKTTAANIEGAVGLILIRLHDILEKEAGFITDILSGNPPASVKQHLLSEIKITRAELNDL